MSGVSSLEGWWIERPSGRKLWYRCWRPPTAARALLVIVHGFGEHGGRYETFAAALAEQRIWVAAADLWGHGRSEGRRGDSSRVADYVRQARRITEELFLPQSGLRGYALFGHSFGGLLAILWALDHPQGLQRVVVQSPLLEVGFPIPSWKVAAARLLTHCWPTFLFPMNLDASALSRDQAVVRGYQADPLVHHVMSARVYCSLLQARQEAFARSAECHAPVLLLCGSADRVISVEAARRWFDRLRGEKRCLVFPECYHELHHEPVWTEVVRVVMGWVLGTEQAGQGP